MFPFREQSKPAGNTAAATGSGLPSNPVFATDLSARNFERALAALVIMGLVVRLGFFVEHAHSPFFASPVLDERYYDTAAKMLLTGGDLHELHGFRPLLYPMFLVACYRFGGTWGTDLALLVQHLLGVGTGVLVALLGARLFKNRLCGIAGGALYLLAPVPLCFEGELLIESSYVFLICFGLWLHFQAADQTGWKGGGLWLLGGAMTALTAQARANILVFLAVYPALSAWRWWRSRGGAAWLPLLGLLGALGMMIPWAVVNMKQSNHFHLMPGAGGVNLFLGNRRGADGMFVGEDIVGALSELSLDGLRATNGPSPELERSDISGERYQDLAEMWAREEFGAAMRAQGRQPEVDPDPMAISSYWTRRAVHEIQSAPADWLRLIAKKCWLMLWNVEVPNNKNFAFMQKSFLWLRALPVRWVVLLALAPVGLWAAAKCGNRDQFLILLVYAGAYSAANTVFFICDRYRYPVWPAMAVFAGGGVAVCFEAVRRRQLRGFLYILAGVVLMSALSLPNWFGAKLPNFAQDYYFRSIAWYEQGHLPEALDDVELSIRLDRFNATTHQHQGNILYALNRLTEAKTAYEQALKLAPGNSGMWNNLGATLEAMGKEDEAIVAFRRAIECKMPSQNAFLGMVFIQIRAGLYAEAATSLDQLAERQRMPSARALATRSVLERRRGNVRQADILEQQARALDPGVMTWAMGRIDRPSSR